MININSLKISITAVALLLSCQWAVAQIHETLTIEEAYALAEQNYPLVRQYALIEQSKAYSIENASKGYLPQASIGGQATYQSDVTRVPVSLPDMEIPTVSKDQYKVFGEVVQPITDLFTTVKQQQHLARANAAVESQKIEVELYQLRDRINQLFFGILLLDAQTEQTKLLKKDIQTGIDQTRASLENGVALKTNLDILEAELLKIQQRSIELKTTRQGYTDMLALFIRQPVNESTQLEMPPMVFVSSNISRPELELFDTQKQIFAIQSNLITAKTLPKFSLFFQGGYGRPALNMLNNDFDLYYIGGLRLSWNLTSFYTYKNEKQQLRLNQNSLDIQQETFLFNTNLALQQQNTELNKFRELIATDNQIIALREQIKNTSQNQLAHGTITANDYILSVNAENKAKQDLVIHQIQFLMAQYNHQTTSGNGGWKMESGELIMENEK